MTSRRAASTTNAPAGMLIPDASDARAGMSGDPSSPGGGDAPAATPGSEAEAGRDPAAPGPGEPGPASATGTHGGDAADASTGARRGAARARRRRRPAPTARPAEPPPAEGKVRDKVDLARIALRALFAGAATEVVLTLLVALSAWWKAGVVADATPLLAHAVGFGLGVGLVFALADLVTRSLRDASGLLLAAPIALLAPLAVAGGAFELAIADGARGLKAMTLGYAHFKAMLPPRAWLVVLLGGVAFHAPLVLPALRDASLPRRALAGLAGGVVWGAAVLHLGGLPDALSATAYLTLVLLRGPVFALALATGDRIDRRLRRREAPRSAARDRPTLVGAAILAAWAALTAALPHATPSLALALLRPEPEAPQARLDLADELVERGGAGTRVVSRWFGLPAAARGSALLPGASERALERAIALLEGPAREGSYTALRRLYRAASGGLVARDHAGLLADLSRYELGGGWHEALEGSGPRRERFRELVGWVRKAAAQGDLDARDALWQLSALPIPELAWGHAEQVALARDTVRERDDLASVVRLPMLLQERGEPLADLELNAAFARAHPRLSAADLAPLGACLRAAASAAVASSERLGPPATTTQAGEPERSPRAAPPPRPLDLPTRWIAAALHGGAIDAAQALAGAVVRDDPGGQAREVHALLALIALERALGRGVVTTLDVRLALGHTTTARGTLELPSVRLSRAIVGIVSARLALDGGRADPAWLARQLELPAGHPAAGVARDVRAALEAMAAREGR